MKTATATYLGALRCETTHVRSGSTFVTDAPVDNQGKGEAFSPTDLLGAALLTCAITTMGIAAQARGWDLGPIHGDVLKTMASNPRRVAALHVGIHFGACPLDAEQRKVMEEIGRHCPVARSLHPDLEQVMEFTYA